MSEIIAAITGVALGSGFQYWLWKKDKTFLSRIDNGGFTVYSDLETPADIWKGLEKDFKSYNDPWLMEINAPDEYVDTHIERYASPQCAIFRFLFFIKKDIGQFERFVKFQSMVHLGLKSKDIISSDFNKILSKKIATNPIPKTLYNIEVFLNRKTIPNQTFFRGYKKIKKQTEPQRISLWYLSVDSNKTEPHLILSSQDKRFWRELDEKWNEGRTGAEKIAGVDIFNRYLQLSKIS